MDKLINTTSKLIRDKYYLAALLLGLSVRFIEAFTQGLPQKNYHLHSLFLFILFLPIIEEVFFRGILQGLVLKKKFFKNTYFHISLANILVSIIFASLHLIFHPILMASLVFIPSLIYGHFREKYNHLLPPIVLHIWYNAIYFTLISKVYFSFE